MTQVITNYSDIISEYNTLTKTLTEERAKELVKEIKCEDETSYRSLTQISSKDFYLGYYLYFNAKYNPNIKSDKDSKEKLFKIAITKHYSFHSMNETLNNLYNNVK